MSAEPPDVSPRARAIIEGLIRTGRASGRRSFSSAHVRIGTKDGGFYFVARDGTRLLRGDHLENAEELQAKFAEAMMRAGRMT